MRPVQDNTRPPGTGVYKFQLLVLFENQRKRSGRFSDRALTAADPPPISDARGGLSPERWITAGMVGSTRFCAWRSTWKKSGGWSYAPSFNTPVGAWSAEADMNSEVRRRQLVQVLQLEVIDPEAVSARAALISPVSEAAAITSDAGGAEGGTASSTPQKTTPAAPTARSSPAEIPEPLEWAWTDMVLQVDVDTLHHVIYKENSDLLDRMNAHRRVTNFEATPWVGEGVNRTREVR